MTFQLLHSEFLIYEEKLIFFLSVWKFFSPGDCAQSKELLGLRRTVQAVLYNIDERECSIHYNENPICVLLEKKLRAIVKAIAHMHSRTPRDIF